MNPPLRSTIAIALSALTILIGACLLAPPGVAQDAADSALPAATDLLRAIPFDRVTLIDGTELVVEPVSPRPLLASEPSKESKRRERNRKPAIPPEGNVFADKHSRVELPGSEKEVGPDGVASDEVRLHLLQVGPKRSTRLQG